MGTGNLPGCRCRFGEPATHYGDEWGFRSGDPPCTPGTAVKPRGLGNAGDDSPPRRGWSAPKGDAPLPGVVMEDLGGIRARPSGRKDAHDEALIIAAAVEMGKLGGQIKNSALGPAPFRKRLSPWQRAWPCIAKFGCRGPCGPRCRLAQRTNHMTNGMLYTGMHHI